MKRVNPRLDVASRKPYPKDELLRLVLVDGVVTLDTHHSLPGRGIYLKRDAASLETALKKKAFERAFHRPLTPEELQAIKEAL